MSGCSLLPHVDPVKLRRLEERLVQLSQQSEDFFVLLAVWTVTVSLGLFEYSSAAIIGAVVIAPFMRPLVTSSLGSLTANALPRDLFSGGSKCF